jgi:hypothetical protein
MLICLKGEGILGLHDIRIMPLKPGWREYMVSSNPQTCELDGENRVSGQVVSQMLGLRVELRILFA